MKTHKSEEMTQDFKQFDSFQDFAEATKDATKIVRPPPLEPRLAEMERRIEELHAWIPLLLKRIGKLETAGEQE